MVGLGAQAPRQVTVLVVEEAVPEVLVRLALMGAEGMAVLDKTFPLHLVPL